MSSRKYSMFRAWKIRRKLKKLAKLLADLSQTKTKDFVEEWAMYDTFLDFMENHLLDDLPAYDRAAHFIAALRSYVQERREDNEAELQHRDPR